MNKHSIDRLFKKKLSGHELPYPEHLWSSIDQRINDLPHDKRRGGLWVSWLGLGLFLLLAGSMGYFWMNSGNTTLLDHGTEQLGVNESVAIKEAKNIQNQNDGFTDDANSSPESESANGASNRESLSEGFADGETILSQSVADFGSTSGKETIIKNTVNVSASNRKETATRQTSANELMLQNSALREAMENQSSEALQRGGVKNSVDTDLRDVRNNSNLQPCEPYKNDRLIESKEEGKQRKISEAVADLGGFGKKRFIGRWSLGLVYAPDWHFRTIATKSQEGEALLNQRERTETFANAFTTGFEIRLKMRQWSVHTGLHYAQINERNRYLIDGSEQMVNGMLVQGDLTRTVINRQQMVQLPILLGYEISRGPWALEVNAGASLGLKSWSSGEVFDPTLLSYAPYDSETSNNPYSNNGQHSWQAGAALSYKMGYYYQWFVRPYYRSYFDSFTKPDYDLKQNYDNLGVTVGCRYLL